MPPLVSSWRAHDFAVVSVEIVNHPLRQLILTASTDATAKLWTTDGSLIGNENENSVCEVATLFTICSSCDAIHGLIDKASVYESMNCSRLSTSKSNVLSLMNNNRAMHFETN